MNGIGDRGAEALAEAVRASASLERLRLEGNGIGDRGAEALAEAMRASAGLEGLRLEGNCIGDRGAEELLPRRVPRTAGCRLRGKG